MSVCGSTGSHRSSKFNKDMVHPPLDSFFSIYFFVDVQVATELQPLAEAWVGFPLELANVYGFRVYQNMSDLNMHIGILH